MRNRFSVSGLLASLVLLAPLPAVAAEQIWVVTAGNSLVNFISNAPGTFSSRPITGMSAGEVAIGIDFRPAPPLGRLYALSNLGQLYVISNPSSGAATPVGPGGIALAGVDFGLDFNPVVDRIRVIGASNQNLRLHPDTGLLAATDSALAFSGPDPNFGADPEATGAAYSNNFSGTGTTALYDIDTNLDVLVTQAPPNNGRLNTVGALGVNATAVNGFDISGATSTAYAALNFGGTQSVLYTVHLGTGTASPVGWIGCAEAIRGLSVDPLPATPVRPTTWGTIKSLYR